MVNAVGGVVNGPIANVVGVNATVTFNVNGTVTSNSTFNNVAGRRFVPTLAIGGAGNYTIDGRLTNGGVVTVASGGALNAAAGGITNNAGAFITVAAGGTVRDDLSNAGTVTNSGTYWPTLPPIPALLPTTPSGPATSAPAPGPLPTMPLRPGPAISATPEPSPARVP